MNPKCDRGLHPKLMNHIAKWLDCTGCPLAERRSQVMFYKGHIPCPVVFVDLGPSMADNDVNRVFSDPIYDPIYPDECRWAVTYQVSCGPVTTNTTTQEEKQACFPKLLEFLTLAKPTIIIGIGRDTEVFLISNIETIQTVLGYRPIVSGTPAPFFILKQSDQIEAVRKARLHVRELIRKYNVPRFSQPTTPSSPS